MGNEVMELKTNEKLLNALHVALTKKTTSQDIMEQRVSYVFGSISKESNVTRERIRKLLAEHDGIEAA